MARREYRNEAENAFVQKMRARGIEPHKRGWPDFWWVEGGRLHRAEVKPTKRLGLKRDQRTKHGVGCCKWAPGGTAHASRAPAFLTNQCARRAATTTDQGQGTDGMGARLDEEAASLEDARAREGDGA